MRSSVKVRLTRRGAVGVGALTIALANAAVAFGQGNNGQVGTDDPPSRVARLSAVVGAVSFQTAGSDAWSQPSLNYTVTTGDRFSTQQGARAELDVGSSSVRIGDGADVTVTNLTDHFAQLGVARGTMRADLYHWVPSDSIEFDTPNGALFPLTAGAYRVSVDPTADVTTVTVDRGRLELTGPGVSRTLSAGQTVQLRGADPIQLTVVSSVAPDDFDRWAVARDQRYSSNLTATQYVSQDMPGWEDLDQYGTWYSDASFGPAWYPANVGPDWIPYRDGQWAWVSPWGWSWVDNSPWGFAPFHYGRWAQLDRGWAWIPGPVIGRPVYAPALVAFVDGASFRNHEYPNMQAWFPLGPREPYFPWYHHSDRYLHDVNYTNFGRGVDIDRITHMRDIDQFHWRNRDIATTAVREETLRSGGFVGRDFVHLRPEDIAGSHLAPHPSVNPEPRLVAGGPPAAHPPLADVQRRARMDAPQTPMYKRDQPPTSSTRPSPASPVVANQPDRVREQRVQAPVAGEVAPARAPRGMITRNPPPPAAPRVEDQARAMQGHPGRPLEPQQIQTMRAGRPAGPPRDAEVPAHVARPAPPAQARPARQPEPARAAPARPPERKPDRR